MLEESDHGVDWNITSSSPPSTFLLLSSKEEGEVVRSSSPVERRRSKKEEDWFQNCVSMTRVEIKPTCNSLHELDSSNNDQLLLSMKGAWRSVWKVYDNNIHNNNSIDDEKSSIKAVVLKRPHLIGSVRNRWGSNVFDENYYKGNELDAFVMERLTSSPHVIRSFGFCGQSVLTEFASIHYNKAIWNKKDLSSSSTITTSRKLDILRLARNLARGLAEVQALQPIDFNNQTLVQNLLQRQQSNNASLIPFSHYDLKKDNIVSVRPNELLLNDFNLGILTRHRPNGETPPGNKICAFPPLYGPHRWRSPEERANVIYNNINNNGTIARLPPSDVYAFGRLLTSLLSSSSSSHYYNNHYHDDDDSKTRRKAIRTVQEAAKACFHLDPSKRPTSLELAVGLGTAYDWSRGRGQWPTDRVIVMLFQ